MASTQEVVTVVAKGEARAGLVWGKPGGAAQDLQSTILKGRRIGNLFGLDSLAESRCLGRDRDLGSRDHPKSDIDQTRCARSIDHQFGLDRQQRYAS